MARLVNNRTPKTPVITVIGEGITEQYYFRHIRSIFGYRYVLKPYFFGTTSLKQMDRKIVEVLEGNGIAVVIFDVDVAQRNEVEKRKFNILIRKYGRKPNVILCDSMPSIEFWFLIHYQNTNRYFADAGAVETELQKFLEGYQKTGRFLERDRWVKELCSDEKLSTAMERARMLGTNGHSWSKIYLAFDEFDKIIDQ